MILIGLDMNYRARNLAITDRLEEVCQVTHLNCSSFHLHPTDKGVNVAESQLTGRYSTALEMYDWLFPILVPRALAVDIEYSPLPANYHPLQVLNDHDPELYRTLIDIQRSDLLEKHTEFALSNRGET